MRHARVAPCVAALSLLAFLAAGAREARSGDDDEGPELVTQIVPEEAKWRLSADGRHVLAFSNSEIVRVYDYVSGMQVRRFGHRDPVIDAKFDPGGRWVGTVTSSKAYDEHIDRFRYEIGVEIWDLLTGESAWRWEQMAAGFDVRADLSFSTSGDRVRLIVEDEGGRIERVMSPAEGAHWTPPEGETFTAAPRGRQDFLRPEAVTSVLSPLSLRWSEQDGILVAVHADGTLVAWDTTRGAESFRLAEVRATSPNGRFAAVETEGGWQLWDVVGQSLVDRRAGEPVPAAIAADGESYASFGTDGSLAIVDGSGVRVAVGGEGPNCEFSGEGGRLVRWSRTAIDVFDMGGEAVHHFEFEIPVPPPPYRPHYFESVAISPDGRYLGWGTFSGNADIHGIDADDWSDPFAPMLEPIHTVAFSADGTRFFAAARLWARVLEYPDTTTPYVSSDANELRAVAMAAGDGPVFASSPDGGRIQMYLRGSSDPVASLTSFGDGEWAVVAPDGRFDASDIESVPGLHWLMPGETLRPVPIDVFMRDFYEPRLLPRLIAEEKLPDVPDVTALNTVQPSIRITALDDVPDRPGFARVTIEVASRRERVRGVERESGALDLRVFREERLVAWHDGPLPLDEDGAATIVRDIRLWPDPDRSAYTEEIEFSAYVFNSDRVKSRTDRKVFISSDPASMRASASELKRTTHAIVMGVNDFDQSRWNLAFAAHDAVALMTSLYGTDLERVNVIDLISESGIRGGKSVRIADRARKEDLRTALRILAGEPVDEAARARLPYSESLTSAQPQDLVILTISTHGVAAADGQFYLLPSDTAEIDAAGKWLESCISAEELSDWLRPIDAEMVLIVDACQSAASVARSGFKPGPMGSRGLGQLAYSKRMRVLAASQSSGVALESRKIRHGLLTYALAKEGLGPELRADIEPKKGTILIGEWLRYAAGRVPTLAEEIHRGEVRAVPTGRSALDEDEDEEINPIPRLIVQTPQLFDFAKRETDIVLIGE